MARRDKKSHPSSHGRKHADPGNLPPDIKKQIDAKDIELLGGEWILDTIESLVRSRSRLSCADQLDLIQAICNSLNKNPQRTLELFAAAGNVLAYLNGIVRRQKNRLLKSKYKRKANGDRDVDPMAISGSVEISPYKHVLPGEVSEAFRLLENVHPLACDVVALHVNGGMTLKEVRVELDTSYATVKRAWSSARIFLRRYFDIN